MVSMMMRNLVEAALTAHGSRDRFADRMTKLAEQQDVYVDDNDVAAMAQLGERYVRETIRLLESCLTAAGQAHAETVLQPVISQCERFFLQPSRGLPDQVGLLGMICNAYLTRGLLYDVSEQTRMMRGFPLIAADPHAERGIIRRLIGSDLTEDLDMLIEEAATNPQLRFIASGTYVLQYSLRATGQVGDWSPSLQDEMSRCGAALGLSLG
ncbi:MAG: hypothetical protein AAF367_02305 [Pseudomonadota bacterium]